MICLVTPTGAREDQIRLCVQFMSRQTYTGKVLWVIVDDAIPHTIDWIPQIRDWEILKVYPYPSWNYGMNTQARNLAAGINAILSHVRKEDIEGIFIIEDDDYYRPNYLERMVIRLQGYDLCGEMNTIYYNVSSRRYLVNGNTIHSSLFQTGFSYNAIPLFEQSFAHKFIDCLFWSLVPNRIIFKENDLAIGMKGMPGRGGIGAGHSRQMSMREDQGMQYLKKLIGNEDAKLYERYNGLNRMSQYKTLDSKRH
jgi:hypothetical protein